MDYQLPKLPYTYDALEPFIDKETMLIHHTKHHQAYVDNLNKALDKYPANKNKPIEDILRNYDDLPAGIRQAVINHGGGHYNHSFFWKILSPTKSEPKGELLAALKKHFGSVDKFKEEFSAKAMGVFGSGWAFLIATPEKKLVLKRHSFQNT